MPDAREQGCGEVRERGVVRRGEGGARELEDPQKGEEHVLAERLPDALVDAVAVCTLGGRCGQRHCVQIPGLARDQDVVGAR